MTTTPHSRTATLQAMNAMCMAWLHLANAKKTGMCDAAAAAAHELDALSCMAGVSRNLARQANEMAQRCHALVEAAADLEAPPLVQTTPINREQPICAPSCVV